ncbi:BCCT family transporter [Corynebacterium striatum]|uniref:BCCT family transporter n=1 Tax=Corynebacterium striatum TaxID=43770 RepID=UPI00223C898D|nr:BCCT family transporter [Corynebacterium striatum]
MTNPDKNPKTEEGAVAASNSPAVTSDEYQTVDEKLESASATSQLQDMLGNEDFAPHEMTEPEIEIAADDDAPIDWTIVGIAGVLIAAIVAWGLAAPTNFANFASDALSFVVNDFGWAYVLFGTIFVVFVIFIAASKFGTIRLGHIDEEPEFSTPSWIAMMFAAGMGIGLMFYGASEPLNYYLNGVPGHEPKEVGTAMATAMFHWTLHPWAVYAIVGLAIAYSTFRIGRKQLLSQAFVPLIGQRAADGWVGKIIDILSIFATVFGTACSWVSVQPRSRLVSRLPAHRQPIQKVVVGIVLVLTLAFLLSAMSGVGKAFSMSPTPTWLWPHCLPSSVHPWSNCFHPEPDSGLHR